MSRAPESPKTATGKGIPVPYRLDTSSPVLELILTGHLSLDELRQAMLDVQAFERTCHRVPHRLTDLSGMEDTPLTMDEMRHLLAARLEEKFPNRFRSALVAPEQFRFGYARMFQTMNTNPFISVAVFTTRSEAIAWLASPMPAQ